MTLISIKALVSVMLFLQLNCFMCFLREFDLEKCLDELFDDNESCKEAVRPLIQERLDNLESKSLLLIPLHGILSWEK